MIVITLKCRQITIQTYNLVLRKSPHASKLFKITQLIQLN